MAANRLETAPFLPCQISRFRVLRLGVSLLALFTLLVLSACQALPRTSDVQSGLSNLDQVEQQVLFDPSGPMPGATQEEILRGFLAAASSASNDYEVAREFLAPTYQKQWLPRAQVLIDDSTRPVKSLADDVLQVSVSAIAMVDGVGALTPLPISSQSTELRFEFTRVDGQWRISSAPAGVVLDKSTFSAVWVQQQLVFASSSTGFVSEPRWFVNDSSLAQQMLAALVSGASAAHNLSVAHIFSAVPDVEILDIAVSSKALNIRFNDVFRQLSTAEIKIFEEELVRTFHDFDGIESVRVYAADTVLISRSVDIADSSARPYDNYVLTGERLTKLAGSSFSGAHDLSANIALFDPSAVSLGADGEVAAVLADDEAIVISPDGSRLVDKRPGLLPPAVDKWGFVWTATITGDRSVHVASAASGQLLSFSLPEQLTGLQGLHISPDGSQLGFLVSDNGATTVYLTSVARSADGLPEAVDESAYLALVQSGEALDFDWIDNNRMAVLTASGSAGKVTVGGFGSFNSERGSIADAVAIAAADRVSNLLVLDSKGRVFNPQGSARWEQTASEVSALAKWG